MDANQSAPALSIPVRGTVRAAEAEIGDLKVTLTNGILTVTSGSTVVCLNAESLSVTVAPSTNPELLLAIVDTSGSSQLTSNPSDKPAPVADAPDPS